MKFDFKSIVRQLFLKENVNYQYQSISSYLDILKSEFKKVHILHWTEWMNFKKHRKNMFLVMFFSTD